MFTFILLLFALFVYFFSITPVLNRICREHGIEPLPPEKSRGTIECDEYREQMRKTEEMKEKVNELTALEAQKQGAIDYLESEMNEKAEQLAGIKAELDDAEKKKIKLREIDSIETKKSVFGNKITLAAEDYQFLSSLAKKQITCETLEKKYKSESDKLNKELASANTQIKQLNAELAEYRKSASFSREKLKQSAQRISREDEQTRKLRRALTVIDRHGLRAEYEQTKLNTAKNTVLE